MGIRGIAQGDSQDTGGDTELGEVLRLLLDFLEALTDRVGLHADLEDGIAHTGLVQKVVDRHGADKSLSFLIYGGAQKSRRFNTCFGRKCKKLEDQNSKFLPRPRACGAVGLKGPPRDEKVGAASKQQTALPAHSATVLCVIARVLVRFQAKLYPHTIAMSAAQLLNPKAESRVCRQIFIMRLPNIH